MSQPSAKWSEWLRNNADNQPVFPWHEKLSEVAGLDRIIPSLRAWQLGETSDGRWLVSVAKEYGRSVGDPDFAECMALFIREEQRHGEYLGRFLDLAGVERKTRDWGDSAFRFMRHAVRSIEVWVTPVVMVETHALVYYDAIRSATDSELLRAICDQLLLDEVVHIRLQCERLAELHRDRSLAGRCLTWAIHRLLFTGMTIVIAMGHRRALHAGGCGTITFWRQSWKKMRQAWAMMAPGACQQAEAIPKHRPACV